MKGLSAAMHQTLGQAAAWHAARRPDAVAMVFDAAPTSFGLLDRNANRVARALACANLAKGDRIAYLGKNCDSYFELLIGASRAGVVVVPIGWRLAMPEVVGILDDAKPSLMFSGAGFLESALALRARSSGPRLIVDMNPAARDGGASAAGEVAAYTAWRDVHDAGPIAYVEQADDTLLLLYTSGTSGAPKGVMLSFRNTAAQSAASRRAGLVWDFMDESDVTLVAMPIAHIAGTGWWLKSFVDGARSIISPEFNPDQFLDCVERQRLTTVFLVPAALQIVVRLPRASSTDLSSLRLIQYGASPIPLTLLRECMTLFKCQFAQVYGMTETAGAVVALGPEDHDPNGNPRMRAAGRPLPGVDISVRDAVGASLESGASGEVYIRSLSVMQGYWSRPDITAAALIAGGWVRTGDVGYIDSDGYLTLCDRLKDMIVSGAENIYSIEVENALAAHPDVAEVAVIGIPDPRWGEAVKAVVVLRSGRRTTAQELNLWSRERLAAFKVPKSVDFVVALPRNASGKILKRDLRAPYWAGHDRQIT